MTAKRILIAIAILAIVCCVGAGIAVYIGGRAVVGLANTVLQPITDATEGFMTNLKNGDYAKAYDQLTPEAQTAVGGSADKFKDALTAQGIAEPESWTFTSFDTNSSSTSSNGQMLGTRTGTATFKGGSGTKNLVIAFVGTATGDANAAFVVKVQSITAN